MYSCLKRSETQLLLVEDWNLSRRQDTTTILIVVLSDLYPIEIQNYFTKEPTLKVDKMVINSLGS